MKKNIHISFALLFLALGTIQAFADSVNESMIDSVSQKLSFHQKLGQTIWLELEHFPDEATRNQILSEVSAGSISGIIIKRGSQQKIKSFIREVHGSSETPVEVFAYYKDLTSTQLEFEVNVLDEDYLKSVSEEAVKNYAFAIGSLLKDQGFDGYMLPGPDINEINPKKKEFFLEGLRKNGLKIITSPEGETGKADAVLGKHEQTNLEEINPKKLYKNNTNDATFEIAYAEGDDWLVDWLNNDVLIINTFDIPSVQVLEKSLKSNKWFRKILQSKSKEALSWNYTTRRGTKIPFNKADFELANFEMQAESIVIAKNGGSLPFQSLDHSFAVLKKSAVSRLPSYISRYARTTSYMMEDYTGELEALLTELAIRDHILVEYGSDTWNPQLKQLLDYLSTQSDITFLVDEKSQNIEQIENYGNIIWVKNSSNLQLDLASQVLFGSVEAKGVLPIDLTASLKEGAGNVTNAVPILKHTFPELVAVDKKKLSGIDDIIKESIQEKAFPGCQIAVVKNNHVIYQKSYGYFTYDSMFRVTNQTIYDLASITKVAATLQAVMFLAEQNVINLDDSISVYLPETIGTNKEGLIIRKILLHEAGLKAYLPFWKVSLEKDLLSSFTYQSDYDSMFDIRTYGLYYPTPREKGDIWKEIISSDLRTLKPGRKEYNYLYSDLGFMILQMIIEQVTNQSMDQFITQNVYEPMGLNTMGFNPLTSHDRLNIAPTEYDYYFRNAQIWGTVHDQNATILGGVAGHAGLFSNALDLAKLMQMNLNGGIYGKYKFIHEQTLNGFTSKQHSFSRRGLGWDKPDILDQNISSFASLDTYGHTGFTGTAVWVDPKHELVYVFLSNRVYPSASNRKLMENNIRTRIQDVIYEAIGK